LAFFSHTIHMIYVILLNDTRDTSGQKGAVVKPKPSN